MLVSSATWRDWRMQHLNIICCLVVLGGKISGPTKLPSSCSIRARKSFLDCTIPTPLMAVYQKKIMQPLQHLMTWCIKRWRCVPARALTCFVLAILMLPLHAWTPHGWHCHHALCQILIALPTACNAETVSQLMIFVRNSACYVIIMRVTGPSTVCACYSDYNHAGCLSCNMCCESKQSLHLPLPHM